MFFLPGLTARAILNRKLSGSILILSFDSRNFIVQPDASYETVVEIQKTRQKGRY